MKMDETPAVVVLSSSTQLQTGVPNAIQKRLESKIPCEVTVWDQGLFQPGTTPLQSFLKQLMSFDAAVLVLGDDDTRIDHHTGKEEAVPRDNVIFELGACMARFSQDRTFMLCPKSKNIVLPSYFKGIIQYTYDNARADGRLEAAVSGAVDDISRRLAGTEEYLASLPAAGLAFGYFDNFVRPIYDRFKSGEIKFNEIPDTGGLTKAPISKPEDFCIYIVVPPKPVTRDNVQDLFIKASIDVGSLVGGEEGIRKRKIEFSKNLLQLHPARDLSIYATFDETNKRMLIFDIPTTLRTVDPALDQLEIFWGGRDKKFKEMMIRREMESFRRSLRAIVSRQNLTAYVKIVRWGEFEGMAFE